MLITTKEKSPDYRRRFENAEIRVQAERVGLWSEKIQISPEKWRRGLRIAE
jgi:endonuclease YncB( thermonuclease family)